MRRSEAGLAVFEDCSDAAAKRWLLQWNSKWNEYSLIGGHVERGESFRSCCIREIEEELHIVFGTDFDVERDPVGEPHEYVAFSESSQTETHYVLKAFRAKFLRLDILPIILQNSANYFGGATEVLSCQTTTGIRIAKQANRVLSRDFLR